MDRSRRTGNHSRGPSTHPETDPGNAHILRSIIEPADRVDPAVAPIPVGMFAVGIMLTITTGITYRQLATPDTLISTVNTIGRVIAAGGQPLGAAIGAVIAFLALRHHDTALSDRPLTDQPAPSRSITLHQALTDTVLEPSSTALLRVAIRLRARYRAARPTQPRGRSPSGDEGRRREEALVDRDEVDERWLAIDGQAVDVTRSEVLAAQFGPKNGVNSPEELIALSYPVESPR